MFSLRLEHTYPRAERQVGTVVSQINPLCFGYRRACLSSLRSVSDVTDPSACAGPGSNSVASDTVLIEVDSNTPGGTDNPAIGGVIGAVMR